MSDAAVALPPAEPRPPKAAFGFRLPKFGSKFLWINVVIHVLFGLGEWPGGDFKAWLLLEKEGASYQKDNPVLPIFKLQPADVTSSSGEAPAFAKEGPVWKAERQSGP